MAPGVLLMLHNAVPGREAELDDWYHGTHLGEILQTPGFASGQRFRLLTRSRMTADSPDAPYGYLTLYEVDDVEEAYAAIHRRARSDRDAALAAGVEPPLWISPALDRDMRTWFFETISDRVTGPPTAG
ncbi:hypothetical protein GIS00_24425 [Nakamurella sp. YIM 132087]|uniref:Uncharacterized protein n=1 Tax=Nakamurella alba TaxID=2665158 RepID=A0A7K1FSG7_9ACTN|nr:hypothetical protein [Nakamurella alba]MTD17086.1 hypothetical protein [Nakamurella alba]